MKHRTGRAELLSELVKFKSYQLLLGEDFELSICWILVSSLVDYRLLGLRKCSLLKWFICVRQEKNGREGINWQISRKLMINMLQEGRVRRWSMLWRWFGAEDNNREYICRCSYNRHQEELPGATSKPHWELSLAATRRTWRRCYALKWVKDGKASV